MKYFVTLWALWMIALFPLPSMASKGIADHELFPRSEIVNLQVYFWKKIFAEVPSTDGLLHDDQMVLPIYETVSIAGMSPARAEAKVEGRKHFYAAQLRLLATALETQSALNSLQKDLLKQFYKDIQPAQLRAAAHRLRFQRGLADRFQEGISRSGQYMTYIQQILRKNGLPKQLGYLPHVESSFYLGAYSKSGAAGIWQFTHTTGKEYMIVNTRIDERYDPFISSQAAAELLKRNHQVSGAWPLALTAYNHGLSGIMKISRSLNTKDLGTMIQRYKSDSFGFASKNFYSEFLAAAEVAENYLYYFGPLKMHLPQRYREVQLSRPMYFHQLASRYNFSEEMLRSINPALTPLVTTGKAMITTDYKFKLPVAFNEVAQNNTEDTLVARNLPMPPAEALVKTMRNSKDLAEALKVAAKIEESRDHKRLNSRFRGSRWATVDAGDTLADVANKLEVDLHELANLNGLPLDSDLEQGKVLKIPYPLLDNEVIVKKGDNLQSIAHQNKLTVSQLAQANNLRSDSSLKPGQRLVLPSKSAPSFSQRLDRRSSNMMSN